MVVEQLTIKYRQGNINKELLISFNSNDYIQRELQAEDKLNINFSLSYYLELPIGACIDYLNVLDNSLQRYYLLERVQPKKNNSESFDYTAVFVSQIGLLKYWYLHNNSELDKSLSFSITANLSDILDLVIFNLSEHEVLDGNYIPFDRGTTFQTTEKTIEFDNITIFDALNEIANTFNCQWYCDSQFKICFKKSNDSTFITTLRYGKNKGLRPIIQRKNSTTQRPTKCIVLGGDKNIVANTYGSKYLLLPKNKTIWYNGTFFLYDMPTDENYKQYKTSGNGQFLVCKDYDSDPFREEITFDGSEIYPRYDGTITNISYSNGNGSNSTTQNTYSETFCLLNITDSNIDSSIDFSQLNTIAGQKLQIYFSTGRLAGRTFDVSTNGYNAQTKTFYLCQLEEDGTILPNDTFYPSIGDKYCVFGMNMPQQYISNDTTHKGAEYELLRKSVEFLYSYDSEQVEFTLPLDSIFIEKNILNPQTNNLINIKVGENIKFVDKNFAINGLIIMVKSIKQYLSNPYKLEITLSNCKVKKHSIKRILNPQVTKRNTTDRNLHAGTILTNSNNRNWTTLPNAPYLRNDRWLCSQTITINGVTFYQGVEYLCFVSRDTGGFNPLDWQALSTKNFDDILNRPTINNEILSSSTNLELATQEQINITNQNVSINQKNIENINQTINSIDANVKPQTTIDISEKDEKTSLRIEHLVGKKPTVKFVDSNGNLCIIAVQYIDNSTIFCSWKEPINGTLIIN